MTVVLDGRSLTIPEVVRVARADEPVEVGEAAWERVEAARARVEDVIESGEPVYGLNTGFGDLVNTRIPPDRIADLQRNLVRSHAAGTGPALPREVVRALLVTRVNALLAGYSGVRPVVIERLVGLLNHRVHPVVRSRGSLGASGDLAPLADVARTLIGEGLAEVAGERVPAAEALDRIGVGPVELAGKEGLALINGTQLSLGISSLLVHDAERVVRAADAAGALTTEVTMGTTASCAAPVQAVRPHPGQAESARVVRALTRGSGVVASHRNCDRVQDAYSIRCLPQVHGAVRDAIGHLREAVVVELNSATDNPLVFPRSALEHEPGDVDARASGTDEAAVVSGGNFHGAPLAHRLDYVVGALTDLAAIAERRVDQMLNPNLQEPHLPAFLARESGVESGLMIAQYSAAALVAECRSTGRAGTDTIPVSGGKEDHASMSATAALHAQRVLEQVRSVVAVELVCGAEAYEYVEDGLALGRGSGEVRARVRGVVPALDGDRSVSGDIEAVAELIEEGVIDEAVRSVTDAT